VAIVALESVRYEHYRPCYHHVGSTFHPTRSKHLNDIIASVVLFSWILQNYAKEILTAHAYYFLNSHLAAVDASLGKVPSDHDLFPPRSKNRLSSSTVPSIGVSTSLTPFVSDDCGAVVIGRRQRTMR
jgi:hypothetical protein